MNKHPRLEWLARKPLWPFNLGAIGSGPVFLRDFSHLATEFPGWAGPAHLLPWIIGAIFSGSVACLLAIEFARSRTQENFRALKDRASRAQALEDTIAENITEIVNGIILGFANKLNLTADDKSRISLYVFDTNTGLINIGRVATNPNHKPVGRKVLPTDKGCIGMAWAEGWAFVDDFGVQNYVDHEAHSGMTPEDIDKLAMKPRFLAALRVDDGVRALAVVVFESMQPNRFDEVRIRREMNVFSGYLTGTLVTLAPHLPKPLSAVAGEL